MELTEDMAFEALGVQKPESQETPSEKKPETADPAQSEDKPEAEGEKAPEVAEPAEQPKQTEEERRAFAARRRQAEQKAATDKAVEEAVRAEREKTDAEWKNFFQKAGLRNPDTGKAITSREEFEAWSKTLGDAEKKDEPDREDLEKLIAESPAMKRVNELLREREEAEKAETERRAQAQIDAELKKIHELDPTINGIDDLLRMPEGEAWKGYVEKGNTFLDAFYLATRERQIQRVGEQAKQKAINDARSKDHLTPVGGQRGTGALSVPREEMELYKTLLPKATEAEIIAHYNKVYKKDD